MRFVLWHGVSKNMLKKPKNTIKVSQLYCRLGKLTGMRQYQVRLLLQNFVRVVVDELCKGNTVYLNGLGKFYFKRTSARKHWDCSLKRVNFTLGHLIPKFEYGSSAYKFIRAEATKKLFE